MIPSENWAYENKRKVESARKQSKVKIKSYLHEESGQDSLGWKNANL